jgi:hypothetical protein
MYELRIDQIQMLDELQSRASTHWEHVDELVELLQSGGQFKEPPVVFRQGHDGDEYFLADGFHRVHAYKKAGIESAIFDVRAGGTTAFRHAKLWSIQSNITHGLRRSNADKRRAVEMLLADEEWSSKSDRWIAETAGVSHTTVQRTKELAHCASSTGTGTSSPKTGKDGKKRLTQNKPPAKKSGPVLHCKLCNQSFRESEGDCPRCFPPEAETVLAVTNSEESEYRQWVLEQIGGYVFNARMTWSQIDLMWLKKQMNSLFICEIPEHEREVV